MVLHVVPLFHVNGWGVPHFVTMIGGRHVMLRKFEPTALMEAVQRHRVTRLLGVPAIFNALIHHKDRSTYDLSSLRQVIIGGSTASPALTRALEEGLGMQAVVGYGLSETTPIVTIALAARHPGRGWSAGAAAGATGDDGWPIPGVASGGGHVGPGRPTDGEQIARIVVRGNTVMLGYYRDPDATAAAIRDGGPHGRHGPSTRRATW